MPCTRGTCCAGSRRRSCRRQERSLLIVFVDAGKTTADAASEYAAAHELVAEPPSFALFAEELRYAQDARATIKGEFTPDDLLGSIFAHFCIGK